MDYCSSRSPSVDYQCRTVCTATRFYSPDLERFENSIAAPRIICSAAELYSFSDSVFAKRHSTQRNSNARHILLTKILCFQLRDENTFSCDGGGICVRAFVTENQIMLRVKADDGSLIVIGQYTPSFRASWIVAVLPDQCSINGETPIPNWPITVSRGRWPVTAAINIAAPDEVRVSLVDAPQRETKRVAKFYTDASDLIDSHGLGMYSEVSRQLRDMP